MYLRDIANILYVPETASENRLIKVTYYIDGRVLWTGKAKDLSASDIAKRNFSVVQILVDYDTRDDNITIPDGNLGKIIEVE